MRKELILSAAVLLLAAFTALAYDAEPENVRVVPAGMELIKVGGTDVLVPRGTKVTQRGAQLILEPPEQYLARKIQDLEEEIARLKYEEAQIKKDIESLKQSTGQNASSPKE